MSHIIRMKTRFKELEDLETAVKARGLEFRRGQTMHKTYGGQRGHCLHAIAVPGDAQAFEIGVVAAPEGEGFDLAVDTYGQTRLVQLAGGLDLDGIRQEYAATVLERKARKLLAPKGFVTRREALPNGRIRLRAVRR